MAASDISYDNDDVQITTLSNLQRRRATVGITAGQPVRLDPSDASNVTLCNASSAASALAVGFAVNDAAPEQPVSWTTDIEIAYGTGVFTVGQIYCVSINTGAICPYSDLASGDFVTKLGIAISTTTLDAKIHASGVAKP